MTKNEAYIICFILIILGAWLSLKLLFRLIDRLTDYLIYECVNDQRRVVENVPYTTLIKHTIRYTNDILYNLNIDHFPSFRIYNYRQQRHMGKFNGEVVVYIRNHDNLVEMIDTCLHEVAHYIQSQTDSDFVNYFN